MSKMENTAKENTAKENTAKENIETTKTKAAKMEAAKTEADHRPAGEIGGAPAGEQGIDRQSSDQQQTRSKTVTIQENGSVQRVYQRKKTADLPNTIGQDGVHPLPKLKSQDTVQKALPENADPASSECCASGPRVVVVGGGTGLSVLLRGLKQITSNITAIVTVADDGGGSGVLREDLGMLPPGDIRNCILALSNTEPLMTELMQYRFSEGRLKGQNFGNLLIAAMVGISNSYEEAIRHISEILAVTGKVLPVTTEDVVISAQLEDGCWIQGESDIPYQALKRKSAIRHIYMQPPRARAFPEALVDIAQADLILLGPGSLYTSLIPNILIPEINEALGLSAAPKVFICNLMTQPGETTGFGVRSHLEAFINHSGDNYVNYVAVNTGIIPEFVQSRYQNEGSEPVLLTAEDRAYLEDQAIGVIADDFTQVRLGYLRHDARKLSETVVRQVLRSTAGTL